MSNFKRAAVTAGPQRNVLASLRATTIIESKPKLPAELIAMILEHLPVQELLRFARVSRRMQEMVYDDSRWVPRLKSMGCWNDVEARQRVEEAMKRRMEAQRAREADEARRTGVDLNGSVNGIAGGGLAGVRKTSHTIFDAGLEEQMRKTSLEHTGSGRRGTADSGFQEPTMMSNGAVIPTHTSPFEDPAVALRVLSKVRSIRGHARQEYGRVYGALAPFYIDLARSKSHTDPTLFRVYRDPEQQAQMLAQLKTFAKSDFAEGWHSREEKLDSMIGIFENAVLREFEQGMEAQDIDGRMRRYAHVLVTLNGGTAGIDVFIQNHPLMTQKDSLGNPLSCLPEGADGTLDLRPSHEFFRQLAVSLNEQCMTIDRVFPPSADVLYPFIDRVADDVVSEYITTLFDEAHSENIETYLKAVSGVFEQALRFAISIRPSKASKKTFSEDVTKIIARCFEQHVDLYLSEELEYFKTKSDHEVGTWERRLSAEQASAESFFMSNVSRQVAKQDFLSSFRKVVMLPVNALSIPFSGSKPVAAPTAVQLDTPDPNWRMSTPVPTERASTPNWRMSTPVPTERASTPSVEAPTSELAAKAAIMNSRLEGIKALFSIEIALNLIHAAKASLERAALFVRLGGQSGEEAREQCEAIFVALLQILGARHIKSGFDKAVNHLSDYNPREITEHGQSGVEPLVTFLELVNVGDLIQQMVDVFYVQELVQPKLSDRDDFLSSAVKEKKRFEQMLDERVAAGLNKGIDVLMDEAEYICATTQMPTDFNPISTGPVSNIGPSNTAVRVIEMVSSHTTMLVGSTEKNMLDVFNQEVGLRLFTVLCKHLKRQRISVDGAITLISDTNHYHTYIRTFKNKSLTEYFDALKELIQIYLIDGSDAKEIGKIIADPDRYHGIFRAEEVYEYAERRADWFTVKKDVEKAMYGFGCAIM